MVFYSLSVRDCLKKDFISYKQSYWCCWRKLLTYLSFSFVDLLELNIDPEWQTISFYLNFIIYPCISYHHDQSCFRLVCKLFLDIEIWYYQLIYTSVVNLLHVSVCVCFFNLSPTFFIGSSGIFWIRWIPDLCLCCSKTRAVLTSFFPLKKHSIYSPSQENVLRSDVTKSSKFHEILD